MDNYKIIIDRSEAIGYAIDIAQDGDMVLILGKGNETYQKMKAGLFLVKNNITEKTFIVSVNGTEPFLRISNIINTTDFILGLKKIAQLEYAVGDVLINVNAEDNY